MVSEDGRIARPLKQHGEHLNRLRDPDPDAILSKLPAFQVQLKKAEANHILSRRNRHFSPPRASASTEFSTGPQLRFISDFRQLAQYPAVANQAHVSWRIIANALILLKRMSRKKISPPLRKMRVW